VNRGLVHDGGCDLNTLNFNSFIALSSSFMAASMSFNGRQAIAAIKRSGYLYTSSAMASLAILHSSTVSPALVTSRGTVKTYSISGRSRDGGP